MTEDTTQPNIPRDYSGTELTNHPERILGCSVYWAILICIISGFVFGLAVFGG